MFVHTRFPGEQFFNMPECFLLPGIFAETGSLGKDPVCKGGTWKTKERVCVAEEYYYAKMGETELHGSFLGRRGDGVSGERD
jgi:hypothetical protein